VADAWPVTWSPSAVADARAALRDAGAVSADHARATYDGLLAAARGLGRRGQVHEVPPEFLAIGITHLREARAGTLRVFYRIQASRIAIVGLVDARHDPGEALFRRAMQALA
jgi:plasmid stabilization system protein ParE